MPRRFKTSIFKASDTGQLFRMYEPTMQIEGSKLISDKAFLKHRVQSNLDMGFAIPLKMKK